MNKIDSTEEFLERLNKKHPEYLKEYEILDNYTGSHGILHVKHKLCGNIFTTDAMHVMRGQGCPNCNKYRKRTTESFEREIIMLAGNEYSLLSNYDGSLKPIELRHNICGKVFSMRASNFISGERCPFCAGRIAKKKHDETLKLKSELDKYTLVGVYSNQIKMLHELCGHTFNVSIDEFRNSDFHCPYCKKKHKKKGKK